MFNGSNIEKEGYKKVLIFGNAIRDYSNSLVIEKYLNYYRHSKQSVKVRKSCLRYFFDKKYFGFSNNIYEITKINLIDYFDYLNHKSDISISTKINKWIILKSFLQFCMEYYDDFLVVIPKWMVKWKKVHKESKSNKDVVLSKHEVIKILYWLKKHNHRYYIIYRIFAETGMRKGELINIDYTGVNLGKRYIKSKGKSGRVVYYISRKLRYLLKLYIAEREKVVVGTEALFLSRNSWRYSERAFNFYLKSVLGKIGVNKNVTCKTFRSTLNTLRKLMGCSNENRKILLNHKIVDINVNHYVKLDYVDFIRLYDRWNPFRKMVL